MQRIIVVAAALAIVPLTGIDARAQFAPWCAYDVRGGTNCGFHSQAQCQAALSGIGGSCSPNPASGPAGADPRRRQRY